LEQCHAELVGLASSHHPHVETDLLGECREDILLLLLEVLVVGVDQHRGACTKGSPREGPP